MRFPSREIVEAVRKEYPAGTRVRLLKMDDPQAPTIGTKGTVTGVDDTGSILMNWDNGSGLNVVYGEDEVEKLSPSEVFAEKYHCFTCPFGNGEGGCTTTGCTQGELNPQNKKGGVINE